MFLMLRILRAVVICPVKHSATLAYTLIPYQIKE